MEQSNQNQKTADYQIKNFRSGDKSNSQNNPEYQLNHSDDIPLKKYFFNPPDRSHWCFYFSL